MLQTNKTKLIGTVALMIGALSVVLMLPNTAACQPNQPYLDSLIIIAIQNHPDVQAMQNMTEAAKARQAMSGSLMNPSLTLGVMDLPSTLRYNTDPATAFKVGVMQRFPWKGKLKAAEKAAGSRYEASKYELEAARQNMAAMVAMAYYDLAATRVEAMFLQEGLRLAGEMTQTANWMTSSTMGALSDIEQARLDEEDWNLRIIANESKVKILQADLAYAAGIPAESINLDRVVLPEGIPVVPVLDSLLTAESINNAPIVKSVLAETAASRSDLKHARLDWYPDIDVMLAYGIKPDLKVSGGTDPMTGLPASTGTIDQMNMISLEISAPIPLFSKGNQRAKISEMAAMHSSDENRVADTRLALVREIRELHSSLVEHNSCCGIAGETQIERANSLYRTALIDYQAGRTPFMELSKAQMSLTMAKMEFEMSRGMAWAIRAKLSATLGIIAVAREN